MRWQIIMTVFSIVAACKASEPLQDDISDDDYIFLNNQCNIGLNQMGYQRMSEQMFLSAMPPEVEQSYDRVSNEGSKPMCLGRKVFIDEICYYYSPLVPAPDVGSDFCLERR